MLQDSFVESLVVRKNGVKGVIFTVTAIIFCIFLDAAIIYIPSLFLGAEIFPVTSFFAVALVFGLVWLLKHQKKEYELEISNELFDCAVITGKDKRSDLVSFSLKECEYIGPVTSDRFKSDKSNVDFEVKLTDLMDYPIEDKYWYCFVNHDGRKYVVVFIFKPEMYPVFRRYNPRATKVIPGLLGAAKKDKADE